MSTLLLIAEGYSVYVMRHGRLEKRGQFRTEEAAQVCRHVSRLRQAVRILDWHGQTSIQRIKIPSLNRADTRALAQHHLQDSFPNCAHVGWAIDRPGILHLHALQASPALAALLSETQASDMLLAGMHPPAQPLPIRPSAGEADWQLQQWQDHQYTWSVLHENGLPVWSQRDPSEPAGAIDRAAQHILQHAAQQGWLSPTHPPKQVILDACRTANQEIDPAFLVRFAKQPPRIDFLPPDARRRLLYARIAHAMRGFSLGLLTAMLVYFAAHLLDTPEAISAAPPHNLHTAAQRNLATYRTDRAIWKRSDMPPHTVLAHIASTLSATSATAPPHAPPLILQALSWEPDSGDTEPGTSAPRRIRIQLHFSSDDDATLHPLASRLHAQMIDDNPGTLAYTWVSD